jgi:hypothetical protein
MMDLRGLGCELLNGEERCYNEDAQGRELCPSFVTSAWLQAPKDQYACMPERSAQYYCTVSCQEGNEDVRWGAHEIAWCDAPGNAGSCPPRAKALTPVADWVLKPWSEVKRPPTACQAAAAAAAALGAAAPPVPPVREVTVGMLTHEPRSMADSLATYEANGLFDLVAEFLIYINKRRPEIDDAIAPYARRHANIRVLGDELNHGILQGMLFLTGNASQPYFLFLERDFQLIEPAHCVAEQLNAGVRMIKEARAHVVRYRHRRKPGRPNWCVRARAYAARRRRERARPRLPTPGRPRPR